MASEEELANLQRLSNDYVSDPVGPLVGQRQSSAVLIEEYAQADPVYVHKTAALPQRYSHYRTVKGDGNCGWRALAFGYFEALLHHGDSSKIATEIARLKSLNNLLSAVGYDEYTYGPFAEETFVLLEQTASSIPCQDDGAALLASFNDSAITGAIITHFRLITSAWLKTNAGVYESFLDTGTIEDYCTSTIDPFRVEMDHMGLNALVDAVVKPAGISVDILYLDRSPGEEVNTISIHAEDPNSLSGFLSSPTIRLLYRPGHYDIIYKIQDIGVVPMPQNHTAQQVHYMSDQPRILASNLAYSQNGLDLENYFLPGLASAGISSMPVLNDAYGRHGGYSAMDLPLSPAAIDPLSIPVHPAIQPQPAERLADSTFRPSKFQVEPEFRQFAITHPEPCQTEAMKQAGADESHYMNERFQPRIWQPGEEYRTTESQSRRSS